MRLDEFIKEAQRHTNFRIYLIEPGFKHLYVRYTKRFILGEMREPVFDIALIEARRKGKGTFTKFFNRLRSNYPEMYIFVENVHNLRFAKKLESLGFQRANPDEIGPSFYLPPNNP